MAQNSGTNRCGKKGARKTNGIGENRKKERCTRSYDRVAEFARKKFGLAGIFRLDTAARRAFSR
jgi:hypothetical protein